MIQIITGKGKGKTTAALGLALRAVGAGLKVAIVFFDKGGSAHYSERKVLSEKFAGEIEYFVTGRDRINSETGRFDFSVIDEDIKEAERGLEIAREISREGKHDILILDEINSTVALGMLEVSDVLNFLKIKNGDMEIILTGRNAPRKLIDSADLVSCIEPIKHYYNAGVKARAGIDY